MKIVAFTSIRSDYDLVSGVFKLLHMDKSIELKLLVSGAHLSEKFGKTLQYIIEDGFDYFTLETLIDGNTNGTRVKSASILFQGAIDYIRNIEPDLIIITGDREDVIIGGLIGMYLNIPILHFFGGDHELDGHADTYIRHATSKLASVHFVATQEHFSRLIALGESKKRIFNIGSVSLDKFLNHKALNYIEMLKTFPSDKQLENFALVIYHPVDEESENSGIYFEKILVALEKNGYAGIVSYPNSDPGHQNIINVIQKYETNKKFLFYKNFHRDYFLSVFKNAKFIIGNSSAGIYEAASVPIPAINVGLRQRGRFCGNNVVFVDNNLQAIENAIVMVDSDKFKKNIQNFTNPYGDGQSERRAYNLIKTIDFQAMIPKLEDPLEIKDDK